MGQSKLYFGGTVLAGLLLGTSVQAAVTSDQLWTKWQSYASAHGATITAGSKQTVGDTTTLKDVTTTFALKNANADVSMKAAIAEIDLRDLGDGTVKITSTSTINIDESITSAKGETTDISLKATQDGGSIIASGSEDDITYTSAANEVAVALDGLTVKGEDIPVDGTVTLSGLNAKQEMKTAADQSVTMTQEGTVDSIALVAKGKDTGNKGASFEATGSFAKVAYSGSGTVPVTQATDDFAAMLVAGFTSNGKLTTGPSSFSANFKQDDKASAMTSSSDSTELTVSMDKSHLQYGVDSKGIALNIKDDKLPVPSIDLKLAESAFNLTMPIAKSDTPQDLALMTKLDGLSVNDEVWAMIDPTKALPRDPATLIVDLSGKGNWLFDLFPILKSRQTQAARTLSGGEQQMLAIARALMMKPKLLILDEPTLGLAPVILEQLSKAMETLRQTTDITVLLGEQNVTFALPHADRVYVIEHSRVVWESDPGRFAEEAGAGYL
ncbi:high-affinity branched-chain amino acid transport ATP-binding protein LivF [mine drainage metagenome]|uniref:High-affinity branched-chain amino acid transport ATP-binding protein LivF n=1 Tax=mine drainage metagenome TaxID=410659 RepID=A0A1J5PUW5_9ZZZZ